MLRTEAAKDRDQGEPDAKEKGERRRVRRLCCESHGPSLVCEIINITGRRESAECELGKGGKTINTTVKENNGKISQLPGKY